MDANWWKTYEPSMLSPFCTTPKLKSIYAFIDRCLELREIGCTDIYKCNRSRMKIGTAYLICIKCMLLVGSYQASGLDDILKYDRKHRTHKAVEKANGLWCHRCYTMDINKEYCMNVSGNDTSLHHKCEADVRTCMVKRVSYSTTSSNTSSVHKVWSLERNCSQKCEAGCIIIGERIKLYQCTSCCDEQNFCNDGSRASKTKTTFVLILSLIKIILLINI